MNRWDPDRCNIELPGHGFIEIFETPEWSKKWALPAYPKDEELTAQFADILVNPPKVSIMLTHKGDLNGSIMCTTVAHELRLRGVENIWLETLWPDDFTGQPGFDRAIEETFASEWLVNKIGGKVVYPFYTTHAPGRDYQNGPGEHALMAMCRNSGILGEISLRPYFNVGTETLPSLPERLVVIQGIASFPEAIFPVPTEDWYQDRFQAVVDNLSKRWNVVQIGFGGEPRLNGTIDLRGKLTVRQIAAVLQRARCYLGQVGCFMQLARAVDCPAVIVYGGRSTPAQTGYSVNVNIARAVACSPCWIVKKCPYDMTCMNQIPVNEVVEAVESLLLESPDRPLQTEKASIKPEDDEAKPNEGAGAN